MKSKQAFTLVELLVVIGLIVLMASGSMLLLNHEDDQRRFERNREAYQELHMALFGPEATTTMEGRVIISGFLADTGRVPRTLEELQSRPADLPAWQPVGQPADWFYARGGRLHAGWRGPYLGRHVSGLYDNWGHPWVYEAPSPENGHVMRLGSLGRNGVEGGDELYDQSFPLDLTLERSYFEQDLVPLPGRAILYDVHSKDPVATHYLGIIYAGIDFDAPLRARRPDYPGNWHPALLRHAWGDLVFVEVTGFHKFKHGRPEYKADKVSNIPNDLFATNLGTVRQVQLALFDFTPANAGTRTLRQALVAIDPQVITFLPRTSTAGFYDELKAKDRTPWVIPWSFHPSQQ